MKIQRITEPEFSDYGKVLRLASDEIVTYLQEQSTMPKEGNIYVREDPKMKSLKGISEIQEEVYGMADIEIGYCNGFNSLLNCMEYHTCPEVDIAGSDLVLLLGRFTDIHDGMFDSKDTKAFLLKKGEAVILNPYTLHFSPCKVNKDGFLCAVILSDKTNMALKEKSKDPALWMVNKWLLAHKDAPAAKEGAYIGIQGDNLNVDF